MGTPVEDVIDCFRPLIRRQAKESGCQAGPMNALTPTQDGSTSYAAAKAQAQEQP